MNGNTFTSMILSMILGLSQKKPKPCKPDPLRVYGRCPTDSPQMPVAVMKPELHFQDTVGPGLSPLRGSSFVFLHQFRVVGVGQAVRTEAVFCSRLEFSEEDQKVLDDMIFGMTDFQPVKSSWWSTWIAQCFELGQTDASCSNHCCDVSPEGPRMIHSGNESSGLRKVGRGWTTALYIYGSGDFNVDALRKNTCGNRCWSNWAGAEYDMLKHSCGAFTSMVLNMVE